MAVIPASIPELFPARLRPPGDELQAVWDAPATADKGREHLLRTLPAT